jgi:hypothetical protein
LLIRLGLEGEFKKDIISLVSNCFQKTKCLATIAVDVNRHRKDDFVKTILPNIPKLFKKNAPAGQEERRIGILSFLIIFENSV